MLTLDDRELAAVLVRHARTAQRLRLEVAALYADVRLARAIERDVGARPGVTRVVASARSGRVLIELAPDAEILAQLETLAAAPPKPRTAPRRARRWSEPPHEVVARAHELEAAAVLAALGASAQDGIDGAEAEQRLARYGANVLDAEPPTSRLALAARQLANLPSGLLLGSAFISLLFGDLLDAGVIVTVVGLNATIGYRMERTSEQLLEAWRNAEAGTAEVIRGGVPLIVNAAELVPGDLLLVRAGNVVPADARILDAHRLLVDEAPLTGESEAVGKALQAVTAGAALADRTCMLYRGTTVAGGHGRAVITATGSATEIGNVQRLISAARGPKARLAARLDALTGRLAWAGIVASGISALGSLVWRRPPIEIMRDTVALGVAAIPEGLPVTSNAALIRAMARMRERGIVVRRLGTAEALGGITVACSDKTGTLTENRMRLEEIWLDGRRIAADAIAPPSTGAADGPIAALLAAAVLNSDLDYHLNDGELHLAGSSTEQAIARAAIAARLDPMSLRERFPRRRLLERRDGVQYVISEHEAADGDPLSFMKGAPEQVIAMCDPPGAADGLAEDALAEGALAENALAENALAENARMAAEGLRVLAVAARNGSGGWRLLGLVALRDPLRAGAADAIRGAADAGIRTLILTGDQRATAEAIARQVGLLGEVIEGKELPAVLADPERLRQVAVVARVTPGDKLAVIEALRASGEIVAMAGDGVNDAPALRAADVGIAVGARSTDLARQTADIVLEHEDLRSILAAIGEGRIVQDNLRRAVRFQVAGNLGELLLITGGALIGVRMIPPLGLLWINLATDTLPALALALESGDPEVLARPPAAPNTPILDRRDWRQIVRDGSVMAAASGALAIAGGPLSAFAAIGAAQFGYAVAFRNPDRVDPHRRFAWLVGGSAALHLAAVVATPLRGMLRLAGPLPLGLVSFAVGIGAPLYFASRIYRPLEITRHRVTSRKEPSP